MFISQQLLQLQETGIMQLLLNPICHKTSLHLDATLKLKRGLQAIVDEHKAEAAEQQAGQAPDATSSPRKAHPRSHTQNSPMHTPAAAATGSDAAAADATPAAGLNAVALAAAADVTATPAAATPAANAATSSAATPVPVSLLRHTQAANLLTGSPLAATPASRSYTSSGSRQQGALASEERRPRTTGMHAPSQATQNTEV